ncbi:FimV/HubP family polar landmark protein [Pseudomonas kuykendallii]|uniref:FimV/HubP family polar landmark protein n=1 Tax=Pseudomonas kuykendallii TaxID=1007099 RepID=UPI0028D8AF80|nr:FimV/HubP family polar landmark protein [Pseudomonas kuykendallii]
MARVHQLLVLTLVSGSALYSGLVPALGLGDINLQSALNQPLSAEIELLDVGDLTRDEIKVRLASQSAFDQSGVDRPFFLNDLRFTPVVRGKGSVVRVVSTQPVREPYLDFIVEVARPGGTLLREYTLLLDPPESSYVASAAPAPSATAAPSRTPRAAATAAVRSAPVAARAPSGPLPAAVQGKHYRVASGDSLWAIARRFNPGGEASLEGLMRDIQLLNPQAFVGGEAHRLKVGAELLLPDTLAEEAPPAMLSLSSEDEELENTRPSAPMPGVPGSPESQAALQRRVDEELASSTAESQSLQQQMRDLQNQLQILQQQLSEKDQQLASLESRLGATPAAVPQATAPAAAEPGPSAAAPADIAASGQPEAPPADAVAPLDDQASAAAPQDESEPALPPTDAAQTAPAQTSPAGEPAPAVPVAEEPAAQEPAAEAEQSTGSSIWLIGAFCLVMLLALLLLLRRRRKPARLPDPQVVVVPVVEDDALVSPARVRSTASVEQPVETRTQISTDPLEAANIYIAYGRFGEAESTLRQALENAPARMDLRLRLLEVLAENGDLGGFVREEAVLREMGASPAQLERIKTRYPAMNADADAVAMADSRVDPLQDAVLDLDDLPPAPVAHAAPDEDPNDYPLNLDDLSLDADWDLINPFPNQASRAGQGKAEVEEEPDFHSNLQELPEVFELDEPEQPSAHSGFEADLSDDFLDAFGDDLSSERPLDDLAARRKMSLAMTYIEQGEIQSACNILNEVIDQGDEQQKEEARELLSRIA